MKMKSADINILFANLSALGNKKLPVKISYTIARDIAKLRTEMEVFEKERIKLCEQMAKKDKDGNPIKITENGSERYDVEDMPALVAAVDELRSQDVEVDLAYITASIDEILEMLDANPDRYDALTPNDISIIEQIIKK